VLIDLVRAAAAEAPDRALAITPAGTLTYGTCLARAEAAARGLRRAGIDRFGIAAAQTPDVVVALVAASAAGSEACVYPRDLDAEGWSRFAERFGHEVVVTDEAAELTSGRAVPLAGLEAQDDGELPPAEAAPVLILTTGTTGDPKGARHEWHRLAGAVRAPDEQSGTRWLLAYNPNQFAGLQVLLHVMVSRATAVVPETRRPEDVLATLREHGVTHVSATPTFWRLLVGRLDAGSAGELSLRQITLGGEASPGSLLARLRELFPDARISHVYAGTEFGSAVSIRDGLPGMPLSVLERSEDAPAQLKIVDGELHMRSRVGMLGYHADGDSADEWRATGDLVEVRDGRIHFVGRTSEIINVGGAKIHPLPIEEIACAVPGVENAAAYGKANPITGQIVVLDVVAAPGADAAALPNLIRTACEALPAAGRPRLIRVVPELKVRGTKLVRGEGAPS
jgi:acyl-CoA synthetase (AMP-forming)/AMP-acid ligase II